jgi:hypothetical protein
MTSPGRAVLRVTVTSSRVRSMRMSATAANGGRRLSLLVDVLAQLEVLAEEVRERRLGRVPLALPVLGDADAETRLD